MLVRVEAAEQVAQVEDAGLDVAVEDAAADADEHVLDEVASHRQRLQDAAGAGLGDDVRLVARLHPRECAQKERRHAELAAQ